jgi:hypothetical protein
MGIGHHPTRWTSLAKKISEKSGTVERMLNVTRASGRALCCEAVVSISAWRRMSFAREERMAR